ncbi:hypothetical protein L1987_27735 [Smallanthus sonchifolius]|uniref:Uncharacterized protein n=1 Tax=Smallanthus sonchifolius TaxID=185202 RepID=A0ACB9IE83_9ASTR|nr:hypothetical protein L1987_27735 [Smallanthus sonchifolius]
MSSLDAELAPLRIPLEDIVIATKDFAEENLLKRGGKADVYKGVLLLRWSKLEIDDVIWKYSSHIYKFCKEEVLYGRKATIEDVNQYLAKNHYEQLDNLRKRSMLPALPSIFLGTAYDNSEEQPYIIDTMKSNNYDMIAPYLKRQMDSQL